MHIGLIGLGKMGFNMRERLRKGGIEVTGFDRNPDVTDVASVDELIAAVPAPRLIWVMVPSGDITDAVITELGNKLDAGDLVIDGGNSRFTEDQKHGAALAEKGIRFRRLRCFRRCVGPPERLRPDGRRRRRRY